MKTIRIVNSRVVNEGCIKEEDILIKNGRIENISPLTKSASSEEIFDAKGKLLLPGMIDAHVHFREPGLEEKGTLSSESQAALSGGITSTVSPYIVKPTLLRALKKKLVKEAAALQE